MILNKVLERLTIKSMPSSLLFDREVKVSKRIPITHFVTKNIFSTRDGKLGAVIKIAGTAFEVKSGAELNHLQFTLGSAIKELGDEFAVYVTSYRHLQSSFLEGEYPPGFAHDFHAAYSEQFEKAKLYVNDIYITLIQKESSTKIDKSISFLQRISEKYVRSHQKESSALRLQQFQTTLTNFFSTLSPYHPKLLGEKIGDNGIPQAEVLKFLSILVNGKERDFTYPYQNIATFVPERRPFFGDNTIHFQGLSQGDDRFGAMLSIKTYSPISTPGILNDLLTVPFEYITTHSFLGIEKNTALKFINTQIDRLNSSGDEAVTQIKELDDAKNDLASGKISYGYHHNTILILSDTMSELEEKVAKIIKIYQDKQLVVVRETLNLEKAFWAQIPGNAWDIRRKCPISSNNFSCFCSLHNYYSGYINENHLGGALMLIETPSKTPYYLNLHERASGRKDDIPKGHTLLIGPSNAGKTVIVTTIDMMYKKHGIRSIFFDRNLGCEIYIRANGGIYNRLLPGEPTHWNPCQLKDTPKNRNFLREFIAVLSTSHGAQLTANDYRQIADVVERNFTLPFAKRNLSNISSFFRLDFTGLEALSRYLRLPDRTGKSGDRAYLFDNEVDELSFEADMMGFDMTHWLSDAGESPEELLPISMYLFHRIEGSLDGRLTAIYLEEGHQILGKPYWSPKIEEFAVTLRKLNAFLFMATQLPDKLAASSLSSAFIQGAATHIFLANPKAREEDYIHHFKLTKREYNIIKNHTIQSRYFLIKQGQEAAVGRINLQGLENYLAVLSGNQKTVQLCEEIRAEVGNDPAKWLPIFYERRRAA
ncbi:MAG: VirB4 family type IV secretion/conjugal transfer ATPase [Gammaproteobacteria bacterium]|nr:MAG: VirB4 family type IV secretion/conjugal transfer ATPase [Gammaproteobacteria bacterium]